MAREITARGAEGVPAYTFLSDAEITNRDVAKERVESLGFAGAVVMRVVESHTEYRPINNVVIWTGPYYGHLWGGYWGWGWAAPWDPHYGYLAVGRVVKVETLVYSVEHEQLVWAGVSRTFNPEHIDSFIAELASAVSKRMAKDGLITRG